MPADKVRMQINLQALVKAAYPGNKQAVKTISPIVKKRSVAREFGERIIDEIVTRTQEKNVDKNGKPFKGYAKSYKKSAVFDIYGKSSGDVNLTLTEKMLSSMIVKNTSEGISIEFADKEQNAKAHGHINGIPRRTESGALTTVVRDFFGVPEKTQIKILKSVVKDFVDESFNFDGVPTDIEAPVVTDNG